MEEIIKHLEKALALANKELNNRKVYVLIQAEPWKGTLEKRNYEEATHELQLWIYALECEIGNYKSINLTNN